MLLPHATEAEAAEAFRDEIARSLENVRDRFLNDVAHASMH